MTIILRLQGLDVKAGAADIRKFFQRLHIPDGGVYIVGGSLREAFIAFTAERDAQLAMRLTGNVLKGSRVTLHVSSLLELEHKVELMMKKQQTSPTQVSIRGPQTPPDGNLPSLNTSPRELNAVCSPTSASWPLDPNAATLPQPLYSNESNLQPAAVNSLDSNTAFLLGVCTVLQGLQAHQGGNHRSTSPEVVDGVVAVRTLTTVTSQPGYVRLFGLPASTTKADICHFFHGLAVEEAIVNVKLGLSHVCLVKFSNAQDAYDALRFNKESLGAISVEVRGASEKMWTSALQECENASDDVMRAKPQPNDPEQKHKPVAPLMKRKHVHWFLDQPAKKQMSVGEPAAAVERVVMVRNLPKDMTKTEIKELFVCPNISHKNVLHLLDNHSQRTDTAFLIFNRDEDYDYAMNLTGCPVGANAIQVSSITKEKMKDMMAKTHPSNQRRPPKKKHHKKKPDPKEETTSDNSDASAQTCLFVRNMPADVKKCQIKSFFYKYNLRDDDISLLLDGDGSGVGEAVVRFKSQMLAAVAAQKLHRQNFLGTQLLLTCITTKQAHDILMRSA